MGAFQEKITIPGMQASTRWRDAKTTQHTLLRPCVLPSDVVVRLTPLTHNRTCAARHTILIL